MPVFLLDEHQVVRPGELGTVEEIEAHAKKLGLAVRKISLDAQFRCGGSEAYVEWVRRLLGLAPGGPLPWAGDRAFSVQVADTRHRDSNTTGTGSLSDPTSSGATDSGPQSATPTRIPTSGAGPR